MRLFSRLKWLFLREWFNVDTKYSNDFNDFSKWFRLLPQCYYLIFNLHVQGLFFPNGKTEQTREGVSKRNICFLVFVICCCYLGRFFKEISFNFCIAKGRPSSILYVVFVDVWVGPSPTTSALDSVIVLGFDLKKSWLLCYRNKRAKTLRVPFNGTAIWFHIYYAHFYIPPLPLPFLSTEQFLRVND